MLGLRPTAAGPAGLVDEPLTVVDATRAVEAVLGHFLDAELRRARDVDPVFARDLAGRVSVFVRRGGRRLRTAFAWCGWRAAGARATPRRSCALETRSNCSRHALSYTTT